jgi:hypothetical protein
VQNIKTGEEWPLTDDLSHDQQETWAIFGVYPNFAWTPDSQHIVYYAKGKIKKIEIVKGPSSRLYGSEAMAGVINIITDANSKIPLQAALRWWRHRW